MYPDRMSEIEVLIFIYKSIHCNGIMMKICIVHSSSIKSAIEYIIAPTRDKKKRFKQEKSDEFCYHHVLRENHR